MNNNFRNNGNGYNHMFHSHGAMSNQNPNYGFNGQHQQQQFGNTHPNFGNSQFNGNAMNVGPEALRFIPELIEKSNLYGQAIGELYNKIQMLEQHVNMTSANSMFNNEPHAFTGTYQSHEDDTRDFGNGFNSADNFNQVTENRDSDNMQNEAPTFDENVVEEAIKSTKSGFSLLEVVTDIFYKGNHVNIVGYTIKDILNKSISKGKDLITIEDSVSETYHLPEKNVKGEFTIIRNSIVQEDITIDLNLMKRELLGPAESLPAILERLLTTHKNVDDLIFIDMLDRRLTKKMNDFMQVNISQDLVFESYAFDIDSVYAYLNENYIELSKVLRPMFNSIVNEEVRNTYENIVTNIEAKEVKEGEVKRVPFTINIDTVVTDTYSKFLGIDTRLLSFDKYTKVGDTSSRENSLLYVLGGIIKGYVGVSEIQLATKGGEKLCIIIDKEEGIYVKKFSSNIQ